VSGEAKRVGTAPTATPTATPTTTREIADVPFARLTVGNRTQYDFIGGVQFALLLALGLREHHTLCDVGCGSLRAGRLLIPYLSPGNYFGIEPRADVLAEGLRVEVGADLVAMRRPRFDHGDDFGLARFGTLFDFVLAQSVFSHTYRDLASTGLRGVSSALAPDGLFVATMFELAPVVLPQGNAHRPDDDSGWRYPGTVAYTWREWTAMLRDAGLVARRIRWSHLRQTWFVAMHAEHAGRLRTVVRGAPRRLRGPGRLGHMRRRALARVRRG
jgi:SAM-dependent methyltransferase